MQRVRYVGPIDEVYNLDLMAVVRRGEVIEASDELAARLLEQEGCWERPAPKGGKPAPAHQEEPAPSPQEEPADPVV